MKDELLQLELKRKFRLILILLKKSRLPAWVRIGNV